jgi:hypothetical protein
VHRKKHLERNNTLSVLEQYSNDSGFLTRNHAMQKKTYIFDVLKEKNCPSKIVYLANHPSGIKRNKSIFKRIHYQQTCCRRMTKVVQTQRNNRRKTGTLGRKKQQ